LAVCAGAPAQKWLANRDPQADRASIERLMRSLESMACEQFVLISTVDVFAAPVGVDERTRADEEGLHAYGAHRLMLERFAARRFPRCMVVRLPGLVGPGLRKNVIYDLRNDNNVAQIDSRGVFQFYPMVNLWRDIRVGLDAGLDLLHLTAAPLSVAEVARDGFDRVLDQPRDGPPARYDMRSIHAARFGGADGYQYSRRESLLAIRCYAQSEPQQQVAAR
ncbi:MAG: pyridine nucleotide transhydrogenase, partial [Delftia acidovorans]|nr:pyridine nucleotide transhydrogenase [Delftia acidovorans]